MGGFTKLFSSIVTSTIWQEDSDTCKIWVTMLALADAQGFVDATIPGLANLAKVPIDKTRSAIQKFLSPDADSRSKEYEGRRIAEAGGGWVLLNYEHYREQRDPEERRQYMREYMQNYRSKHSTLLPCVYCGQESPGIDHVIPSSKGGTDDELNTVPCCESCNKSKKHDSLPQWFFGRNKIRSNVNPKLAIKNVLVYNVLAQQLCDEENQDIQEQCKRLLNLVNINEVENPDSVNPCKPPLAQAEAEAEAEEEVEKQKKKKNGNKFTENPVNNVNSVNIEQQTDDGKTICTPERMKQIQQEVFGKRERQGSCKLGNVPAVAAAG